MARGSGWGTPSRRVEIIKWSGAECRDCAGPVELVRLDADPLKDPGTQIPIERRVINTKGQPGDVAARVIAGQMHGYVLTTLRALQPGYSLFHTHASVCPEAPPPPHEQHTLFDPTQEGDTTT